jgi:hypothetical protein
MYVQVGVFWIVTPCGGMVNLCHRENLKPVSPGRCTYLD